MIKILNHEKLILILSKMLYTNQYIYKISKDQNNNMNLIICNNVSNNISNKYSINNKLYNNLIMKKKSINWFKIFDFEYYYHFLFTSYNHNHIHY